MSGLPVDSLVQLALALALGCGRVVGLLLFVPLLPRALGGQLIRAGTIAALGCPAAVLLQETGQVEPTNVVLLMATMAKEVLIGAALGLVARLPLIAIQAYGAVIDNLRGAFAAEQADRSRAPDESLLADAMHRLLIVAFIQSGALLATLAMVYSSYAVWPVDRFVPPAGAISSAAMLDLLGSVMAVATRFALPFLLVCLFVDVCLAFVAVAAPQAETYFLSMPLKSVLSVLLLHWVISAQVPDLIDRHMPWMKLVFPWAGTT